MCNYANKSATSTKVQYVIFVDMVFEATVLLALHSSSFKLFRLMATYIVFPLLFRHLEPCQILLTISNNTDSKPITGRYV